jgi:hypothetical protein
MRISHRSGASLPSAKQTSPSGKIWWALQLLVSIAIELISCVEARLPLSPERIEAIRALERVLEAECSGEVGEPQSRDLEQSPGLMNEYEFLCTVFLE